MSVEPSDAPATREGNNPALRSSQNKPQLLEAMMRNVPKLKELNYTQWKNIITNSIKKAKLWGYVDGSIEEPGEHDASHLTTYYDEATAVRNAILGSLESGAQKYIEEALDPRDAWLTLEKKYLTAEAETDTELVAVEKQLADLRLEEGGDMIEHIAEFCRRRSHLSGTRLALDDQASISMLYRSLPWSYRQSAATSEGTEMKDFGALCARLSYLSQSMGSLATANNTPAEDYTNWGVPQDIRAYELTADKNPLLAERAAVTCRDCLLKDHKAGTPECPQYEWRKALWGAEAKGSSQEAGLGNPGRDRSLDSHIKQIGYEFSEPIKVILDFDELGLRAEVKKKLRSYGSRPLAIQQCAILPMINRRNVLAVAPRSNGKTTSLVASILHIIDTSHSLIQALVLVPTQEEAIHVHDVLNNFGAYSFQYDPSKAVGWESLDRLSQNNYYQTAVGTADCLLGLIHRNILNTRNLKVLALDNLDKIAEAGSDKKMFEVYQQVPPFTQIIASSTSPTSFVTDTVTELLRLVKPVRIAVTYDERISIRALHYFVKVPARQKLIVLRALFRTLPVKEVFVMCTDNHEIKQNDSGGNFYYLEKPADSEEHGTAIRDFQQSRRYNSGSALVITDAALPIAGAVNVDMHLVNYDIPTNLQGYVERLNQWTKVNPRQSQKIITFITPDTPEIQVLYDFQRYYGVRIGELMWDQNRIY